MVHPLRCLTSLKPLINELAAGGGVLNAVCGLLGRGNEEDAYVLHVYSIGNSTRVKIGCTLHK